MIDEDWRGFTSAFTQAIRPNGTPGAAGRRMLAVGFAVVVVAALGSLLDGAFGGGALIADPNALTPVTASPTTGAGTSQSGSGWTAVAGPSCASGAGNGFAAYGYYAGTNSDGTTGWSTTTSGGYSGGSCTGGYLSLPVSGKADSFDPSRFALWTFDFSQQFTSASCQLSTYVPESSDRRLVGGAPAYYYYYQSDYTYGSTDAPLGGYLVSQVSNPGSWVTGTSFKVRTGKVTVKLVDAGSTAGSGAQDAHVAAAQVRITCQPV
jgi:hypothetical protein